ncbi:MAG: tetratricopeptide repeat protein [Candidatus Omnitrophica bacterium]|nr:tetratricopeptide repeat protein [Candidatus Omnitrophota bacterium]
MRRSLIVIVGVFIVLTFCINIFAQDKKVNPLIEKGIGQYKHENYEEALVTLKKARGEEPDSTLAAYYLGLTYKQLQDYPSAVAELEDAVTYSPKIKGALIELVDCLYQTGRLEEAYTWIEEAREEGIRPAQISFLNGLVLAKDKRYSEAISSFENAMDLDPAMSQSCEYQIGMLHLKTENYLEAKKVFEQVVIIDPNNNMANFANEYMNALDRRIEASKPFKFSMGSAWQYDDNVVLKPSGGLVATNITDNADMRQIYTGKAEYNHRFNKRFGLKGQFSTYISKQYDLGFYDTFSNTFTLQPSLYLEKGLLTFPVAYNHTCINDKAYLSRSAVSGIYNFMVGKTNMGQVFVKYQNKEYLWDPSRDDENRDGNDLGGGIGWYFFFAENKGFLNVRYALNKEWTAGDNWEYTGNRATVAVLVPIMEKLNLTVTGDMYMQDFGNTHTVYGGKRDDDVYTGSALLAYKFYENSELQLQYTFIKDSSNISIYEYDRNIFSVGVEINF